MKYIISFSTLFLFVFHLQAQIFPVTKIKDEGIDAKRINMVVLPDGYTSDQLSTFLNDAENISNELFATTPFKEYSNFFNTHAIEVPSIESGADHPGTATDVSEPASPVVDVDTYFGSTFDYFDIHRLLVPVNGSAVSTVLANNYPGYDQVIVLANTTVYGGSGGWLATTSLHASAPEIAIHEIGHSFGGLADEYYAGDFYAGERYNMTAETDPNLVKWNEWMNENGIGIYAHCCGGESENWYRPHQSCKMRYLGSPFCSVCTQRFIDRIYELVTPIDSYSPANNTVNYTGGNIDFVINTINPEPNTLKVEWLLNGNVLATDVNNITLGSFELEGGTNSLVVRVTDETSLSRSYLPAGGYVFEQSWTIENNALPVEWLQFEARAVEHFNQLDWQTASEKNTRLFEIERSADGLNWTKIGEQTAQGSRNQPAAYRFIDSAPVKGVNYYRLKEISNSNRSSFSPIRQVQQISKWFYKVFPNPTDGPIFFEVFTNEEVLLNVEIFDINGKLVKNQNFDLEIGNQTLQIDLAEFPAGSYSVKMKKDIWSETVIVEVK